MEQEPSSGERRRHPRVRCSCLVSCRPMAGGEAEQWWDGEALDIARGGLLIVCEHWFDVRDVVKIRMHLGEADTVLLLTARVVRVRHLAEGKWLIGCQIMPDLREDEVSEIRRRACRDQ